MAKKIDLNGLDHFKEKENASIAIAEATSTASAPHKVGEYFYYKGDLVIATADIAQGGTITLNTNCKKQPLADSVCELKTALSEIKQRENVAFEQGTINSTAGTEDTSSKRIRSKVLYKNDGLYYVQLSSGFQFLISCYDANNAYLGNTSFSAATDLTELKPLTGTTQFRFLIKNDSNTDLAPSDLSADDFIAYSLKQGITETAFNALVCEPKHYTFVCRDSRVTDKVPPNSIYAIKAVAENQYDRIRFSVTKTTDGKYVAVHDTTINNLACNKNGTEISSTINTADCTLAQLNLYDWGQKFGIIYKGLQVPMVEDCIALATKYSLPIALDFKWTPDDSDIDAIFEMLAKYGQLDAILYALSIANMQKFYAKSKRISFQWTAPTNTFNTDSHFNNFIALASQYNTLYWLPDPLPGYPSDEDLQRAVLNDIKISHTQITDVSAILSNADKGVTMWECHHVPNIKTALRNAVNDTIE